MSKVSSLMHLETMSNINELTHLLLVLSLNLIFILNKTSTSLNVVNFESTQKFNLFNIAQWSSKIWLYLVSCHKYIVFFFWYVVRYGMVVLVWSSTIYRRVCLVPGGMG